MEGVGRWEELGRDGVVLVERGGVGGVSRWWREVGRDGEVLVERGGAGVCVCGAGG